jgi:hypothetical protein
MSDSDMRHRITGSSLVLTIIFLNFYKIFFVVSRKHKHCFLKVLKMSKRKPTEIKKSTEIKSYFLPGPDSSQSTMSSQQSLSSSSSLGRSSYFSSSTMSSSSSLSRSRAFSQGFLSDADAIQKERLLRNYIKNAPTRHLPFRCQHFFLFGFFVFCF